MLLFYPNHCVVLGIDSGKISGWGVVYYDITRIKLAGAGTANSHIKRKEAYEFAVEMSRGLSLPLVIGRETWTPGWTRGKRSFKSILGTGASWGKWESILEEAGFPKSRVFSVTPNVWRKAILDLKSGRYNREQAKAAAINAFISRFPYTGRKENITHDMAEGSLIAYYMMHDSRVAEAIKNPGRLKKI